MITLSIPGFKEELRIKHLMLDFNGTLAVAGKLIDGVREALRGLANKPEIHIITGNTFGTTEEECKGIPCKITLLDAENQGLEKEKYSMGLNPLTVIGIGNGRNDMLMIKAAAIGIVVIQKEGAASETLAVADIVCTSVIDALELINNPMRLKATLRN